jgi:hypothetical protein
MAITPIDRSLIVRLIETIASPPRCDNQGYEIWDNRFRGL